jgi:hypothetical protein
MLYAVTIEPLNATCFVSQQPDDNEWEVQEGVELEIPFNYDTWSDGAEPPDQILCISVTDPKHYKNVQIQAECRSRCDFGSTGVELCRPRRQVDGRDL